MGVGLAVACGSLVGTERQLRGKPAGVRTSVLVCMGTFLFVHLSRGLDAATADPSRVLGQVVTGVGFLGAGVILSQGGYVRGVTSAAVIWVLAAIGAAIGLERGGVALSITLVTLVTLAGVPRLERALVKLTERLGVGEPPDDD
jgi:putative Mg2+ transporter-C (MgtC) family protein